MAMRDGDLPIEIIVLPSKNNCMFYSTDYIVCGSMVSTVT